MTEPTIAEIADQLRAGVTEGLEELVRDILVTDKIDDRADILGSAIVDGRTDEWLTSLRLATILEEFLEDNNDA